MGDFSENLENHIEEPRVAASKHMQHRYPVFLSLTLAFSRPVPMPREC